LLTQVCEQHLTAYGRMKIHTDGKIHSRTSLAGKGSQVATHGNFWQIFAVVVVLRVAGIRAAKHSHMEQRNVVARSGFTAYADPGEKLGQAIATGDFNGDSLVDIAIGAPRGDVDGNGVVYVILGHTESSHPFDDVDFTTGDVFAEEYAYRIYSADPAIKGIGAALVSVGDWNDDGSDELAVAATLADGVSPVGATASGSVYIIFGSGSSVGDIDISTMFLAMGVKIPGFYAGQQFGAALAAAQVEGAEHLDLLIGSPLAPNIDRSGSGGAVYVIRSGYISAVTAVPDLIPQDGYTVYGVDDYDRCGASVSSAGDINGDSAEDMLIGCPGADYDNNIDVGKVAVVFGETGRESMELIPDLATSGNGYYIFGPAEGSGFGEVVTSADINEDGYRDAIIGAPTGGYDGSAYSLGVVYVVFGHEWPYSDVLLTAGALGGWSGFRIVTATLFAHHMTLADAGDVNEDGHHDLLIGVPTATLNNALRGAGAAYVVYRPVPPTSYSDIALSSFTTGSSLGYVLVGESINASLGCAVSGALFIDGGFVSDFVVGAAQASKVYVVFGSLPEPSAPPTVAPTAMPSTRAPTRYPSYEPTIPPSATPTLVPTAAPTTAPSGPSVSPTKAPTAKPTTTATGRPSFVSTTDCRSACSFGFNTPITIQTSQNIGEVLLNDDFEVTFDVKLNALASLTGSGYENIMEIADRSDYTPLFRVHITQTTNLRVSYNNFGYITNGPYHTPNYSGTYSTVRLTYQNRTISLWTSASQTTETHAVTDVKPTAGNVYSIYVSTVGLHTVNPWGYVRNIVVRGRSKRAYQMLLLLLLTLCCCLYRSHSSDAPTNCESHNRAHCGSNNYPDCCAVFSTHCFAVCGSYTPPHEGPHRCADYGTY
jgi:hypothetical protein